MIALGYQEDGTYFYIKNQDGEFLDISDDLLSLMETSYIRTDVIGKKASDILNNKARHSEFLDKLAWKRGHYRSRDYTTRSNGEFYITLEQRVIYCDILINHILYFGFPFSEKIKRRDVKNKRLITHDNEVIERDEIICLIAHLENVDTTNAADSLGRSNSYLDKHLRSLARKLGYKSTRRMCADLAKMWLTPILKDVIGS